MNKSKRNTRQKKTSYFKLQCCQYDSNGNWVIPKNTASRTPAIIPVPKIQNVSKKNQIHMATMAVASSTPSWSSVLFFKVWWYIPIDFGDFLYVWEKLPGQPNIIIYNYLAWTTKTLNKHHLTSCFFEHVFFSRSSRSEFISET